MRTQEEIVQKIQNSDSFLGFEKDVWFTYLDFEHAKPFCKEGTTEKDWDVRLPDEATVIEDMREYAERIGWEKIVDHRGISARRTVEKMCAWLWLLGTPQADELIVFARDNANYPQYGAPILARICETYGFPIPTSEDVGRMRNGLPCREGCEEGCGG